MQKNGNYPIKHLLFSIALALIASCSGTDQSDSYVFRNDERPQYSKTISIDDFAELEVDNATIIDVRLAEDLKENPTLIRRAIYRDPEMIVEWANQISKDKKVIVYCEKGKWVSQKAATYLSERGYEVYSLEGGIRAWDAVYGE